MFFIKFLKKIHSKFHQERILKKSENISKIYTSMYENIACNIIELICICKKSQNSLKN